MIALRTGKQASGGEPMPYKVSGLRSWNMNADAFYDPCGNRIELSTDPA